MKPNREVSIAFHTMMASLRNGMGRHEKALDHFRALVPWAPNRPQTYYAMDTLANRGLDPSPGIPWSEPARMCLFVGYPRSGHSLVGALLDAHPEVVLAHELNFIQGLQRGLSATTLARFLRYNAATFANLGRAWSGYSYQVPGQWQGKASSLKVLGDKHGAGVSRYLASYPGLLNSLEDETSWPITFLHVVRNPFDNITTWSLRKGISLEEAAEKYFQMANTVSWLKGRWPDDSFLEVHLDDFTTCPDGELSRLLKGLGVQEVSEDYLASATSVVFESSRKTRDRAEWPARLVDKVVQFCETHPFLERYQSKEALP